MKDEYRKIEEKHMSEFIEKYMRKYKY